MTRVLVTGAAGFLGRRLTRALIERGELADASGASHPLTELTLTDIAPLDAPEAPGLRVTARQGDLSDPDFVAALAEEGFDSIFHLSSFLTIHAEKDPARAWAVNVEAPRRLMDAARNAPKFVFASSIAIFGGDLPPEVGDDLNPTPTTTYGTHKAILELLIADCSRHGLIDGRSLRLPIVLLRPGAAQPAVSDRTAAIAREPMEGRDIASPLRPAIPVPVVSAGKVIEALIRVHDLPAASLPPKRAFNLPALTVTPAGMAEAVARMGGKGRVTYAPDPEMERIVAGWPARFVSAAAAALGIVRDADFDAILADYLRHRDD